jgi:hypothetical protein
MGKLLLLVAGLFLALALMRVFAAQRNGKRSRKDNTSTDNATTPNHSTKGPSSEQPSNKPLALLPCTQCGVHMSQQELHAHQANHP